jgi:hypothetical protein
LYDVRTQLVYYEVGGDKNNEPYGVGRAYSILFLAYKIRLLTRDFLYMVISTDFMQYGIFVKMKISKDM